MSEAGPSPSAVAVAPEVVLQNPHRFRGPRWPRLRRWLRELVGELGPEGAGLTARIVDEREIRRLNREFREADRATDVLSFPGERTLEGPYLGDVVVCLPVARRQAEPGDAEAERELRRLLLHGVLHCLGYDHETDGGRMVRLERRLRRRWVTGDA